MLTLVPLWSGLTDRSRSTDALQTPHMWRDGPGWLLLHSREEEYGHSLSLPNPPEVSAHSSILLPAQEHWPAADRPTVTGVKLGEVKVSIIRWLLFCQHHTIHPLRPIPGTRQHGSVACSRLAKRINSRGAFHLIDNCFFLLS